MKCSLEPPATEYHAKIELTDAERRLLVRVMKSYIAHGNPDWRSEGDYLADRIIAGISANTDAG